MSDDIPILDITAEDKEAEALRYADAVAMWHAAKQHPTPVPPDEIDFDQDVPDFMDPTLDPPKRWFKWPCDRRDAHHPHPEDGCEGVRAHPLTQIGGNYKPEEIEE